MNETNAGQPLADSDAAADGGAQRGLIGRLFTALSPSDPGIEADRRAVAATAQALPGLANLRKLRVNDVAIPKAEIAAVPVDIEREGLIGVFRESGFSRLPVYADTLDRPLGLLLLKDLVLRHGLTLGEQPLDLKSLLRPLLFVPPSMPLTVLLQKMQTGRTHMALVIDEYGGVDGLVTIEDLIEQVVGEIDDEHDTEDDALWHAETPGVWVVQARATLGDFRQAAGLDLTAGIEDEDIDTLGGLVFFLAGRVPVRSEVVAHPAGFEMEVLDADPRRVKRLRVRRAPADAAAGD